MFKTDNVLNQNYPFNGPFSVKMKRLPRVLFSSVGGIRQIIHFRYVTPVPYLLYVSKSVPDFSFLFYHNISPTLSTVRQGLPTRVYHIWHLNIKYAIKYIN